MTNNKFLTLLVMLTFTTASYAHKKHDHKHSHSQSSLGAHVHGEATLNLAIESDSHIKIEMEIPGESVVGFEHAAKSEKELNKIESAKKNIQGQLFLALGFPTSLGCKEKSDPNTQINNNDGHAEWKISLDVICSSPVKNSELQTNFSKLFSGLKKVKVNIIGEDLQKTHTLRRARGKLSLKP